MKVFVSGLHVVCRFIHKMIFIKCTYILAHVCKKEKCPFTMTDDAATLLVSSSRPSCSSLWNMHTHIKHKTQKNLKYKILNVPNILPDTQKQINITERVINNASKCIHYLASIKELRYLLGFGSDYSSLRSLKQLPLVDKYLSSPTLPYHKKEKKTSAVMKPRLSWRNVHFPLSSDHILA